MIATEDLIDWVKAEVEDTVLLRRLEQAAVEYCQQVTGRYYGPVATITETIRFQGWPLPLANEPIGGVVTSLEKWDSSAWVVEDAATYYVQGSFLWSYSTFSYPSQSARFRVVYQAGFPAHETDPDVWFASDDVQQAVRLLVGHWFENREAVGVATTSVEIQLGVQAILGNRTRVAF